MSLSGYSASEVKPLHPPPSFDKIRHLSNYVQEGKDAKGSRRIFHKVQYTPFEEENIQKYERALIEKAIELPSE